MTWSEPFASTGILGQRFEDSLAHGSAEHFQVSDAELYSGTTHAMASDGIGEAVVVWTEPSFSIRAQLLADQGDARGGHFLVTGHSYIGGTVGIDERGDFVVVWDRA